MNTFQKIGAGLLLLFGGDGPAAQRAGDALLADRIDEAVEEGGFTDISYGAWRKAQASASRLEFDDIRLERDAGAVFVERAEMEVFSQALSFRRGYFSWAEDQQRWSFDGVEIARGGLFSRTLRISARGLEPEARADADGCDAGLNVARCALADVGRRTVSEFHLLYRRRSRDAVVSFAWATNVGCWVAWTSAGRGEADLATWGERFFRDPSQVSFRVAESPCELPQGDAILDTLPEIVAGAGEGSSLEGEALLTAAPVLTRTLFGLVAQSYAYLLE